MLESVFVDINSTLGVSETGVSEELSRLGGRVDASGGESLLDDLVSVNVLHDSNLLTVFVLLDLKHFPAEHHIDASLVALFEGDLVGVWELVDRLVGGPVLDSSVGGGAALNLVLSHEVLIVKSVEITTLTLVRVCWGVTEQVTVRVVPTIVEVAAHTFLMVKHVHEDTFFFRGLGQFLKSLDVVGAMVESRSEDEGLVVECLFVG